jgi:serine/tyrosine/threonine adenylyltransferase
MTIAFDHSYARELPGTYLRVVPDPAPAPRLVILNQPLADQLGLALTAEDATAWFSGAALPPGADPIAQAYAGHQFGGFSPQLGRRPRASSGRDPDQPRRPTALRHPAQRLGPTPFSRGGDGKAALGPMLREYLISEAMAALACPRRALWPS